MRCHLQAVHRGSQAASRAWKVGRTHVMGSSKKPAARGAPVALQLIPRQCAAYCTYHKDIALVRVKFSGFNELAGEVLCKWPPP
jgi:hypothetical protein